MDIVYFELFLQNQALNSDKYFFVIIPILKQQKSLELANRKGFVFHHDNARLFGERAEIVWLGCPTTITVVT